MPTNLSGFKKAVAAVVKLAGRTDKWRDSGEAKALQDAMRTVREEGIGAGHKAPDINDAVLAAALKEVGHTDPKLVSALGRKVGSTGGRPAKIAMQQGEAPLREGTRDAMMMAWPKDATRMPTGEVESMNIGGARREVPTYLSYDGKGNAAIIGVYRDKNGREQFALARKPETMRSQELRDVSPMQQRLEAEVSEEAATKKADLEAATAVLSKSRGRAAFLSLLGLPHEAELAKAQKEVGAAYKANKAAGGTRAINVPQRNEAQPKILATVKPSTKAERVFRSGDVGTLTPYMTSADKGEDLLMEYQARAPMQTEPLREALGVETGGRAGRIMQEIAGGEQGKLSTYKRGIRTLERKAHEVKVQLDDAEERAAAGIIDPGFVEHLRAKHEDIERNIQSLNRRLAPMQNAVDVYGLPAKADADAILRAIGGEGAPGVRGAERYVTPTTPEDRGAALIKALKSPAPRGPGVGGRVVKADAPDVEEAPAPVTTSGASDLDAMLEATLAEREARASQAAPDIAPGKVGGYTPSLRVRADERQRQRKIKELLSERMPTQPEMTSIDDILSSLSTE